MAFIELNKRIVDYAQYREDVQVFIALLFEDLLGYATTLGMTRQEISRKKYHTQIISMMHEHLDLEVKVMVKKKSPEKFV